MAIRTTVDIPESLHEVLSQRAAALNVSVRALILRALEDAYCPPREGALITGPFLSAGELGPEFPTDQNPHELVFS